MGNSLRCISQEQDPNQKKPSVANGEGESSNSGKHVRRLSLIPSFRRRTLLPSLSCSGSSTSTSSTSKKGGIKAKKKIRERHNQEHHRDNEKDSLIQEQTLAATNILFSQTPRNSNSAPPFRRSTSVVYPASTQPAPDVTAAAGAVGSVSGVLTPKKFTGYVRSSSNRQRSSTDPVLKPNQLLDKASTFHCFSPLYRLFI
ncbi:unnamed protein product [Microthlaspi erraticum]|uniref:Uncharacterized protein n=1 Tax=Microthlaspi erraticum TaxID=1685480 RepID=A0A6D2KX19_9BRAS|nr:unnamed protein product [Microthlaspi erraticum]